MRAILSHRAWLPLVVALVGLLVASVVFTVGGPGEAQAQSADTTIRQVDVGQNHACVVHADRTITCWGSDANGQVSDWGDWAYRDHRFSQVSAGSFLTCGIRTNYTVMCWGYPEKEDGNHAEASNNLDWNEWTAWVADPTGYGSIPIDPDTNAAYTSPSAYDGWVNTPPDTKRFQAGTLSVGNYHACAIDRNGKMACWGKAGDMRLVIPTDNGTPITDWTMVEAGFAHNCGIREGGAVTCWGRQSHNRSAGPSGAGPFIDVTLALYNGCALAEDGSVECWGGHSAYETFIHPSDPDQRAVNTQINTAPEGVTFKSIEMSTTELYGCGLSEANTIHCWGWGLAYPAQMDPVGGKHFAALSVGSFANCGRTHGGDLECWGIGDHGVTMPPAGDFTQVEGGVNFGCAVKADQSIVCWGHDGNRVIQETPATGTFTKVAADNTHACAIKTDGTVQCWGGVFLSGTQYLRYAHAVAPTSGTFTDLDAGPDLTCGVKTDGTLECWGGNATPDTHNRLTEPSGSFSRVAVGATHACAIKSDDRSIECWGEELFFDREGDGTPDDIDGKGHHTTTTPPSGTHKYIDITAGSGHTCAIREDKKAVCWGYHADGRNNVPGSRDNADGFGDHGYSDIATGGFNNCAIRSDNGQLSCWNHEFRQYWPSSEVLAMTGFKSLGAGQSHMCAIDSGDGLVCWGAGTVIPFPAAYGLQPETFHSNLRVRDLGDGKAGCDNTHADASKKCSAALLDDDDFTFQGVPVHVTAVYTQGGYLYIGLDVGTPNDFRDYDVIVQIEQYRISGDAFPIRVRSVLGDLWDDLALEPDDSVSITPQVQFTLERSSGPGPPPRATATPPPPPGGGGGGGGGAPPPPEKAFSIGWVTVAEGETARLVVILSPLAPQPSGLTFDVSYDYSGSASADDTGATPATLHVPASQSSATLLVPIAADRLVEGDESFTVTFSPRIGDQPNRPPAFAEDGSVTRSIAENAAADALIGAPVQAGDPDGDTLAYSLGGTDAASFDINTANGQLLTRAALDRETKGSYAVTVTAEDPDGLTASIDVTITVTDVDEAPELSGSAAVSYAESRTGPVATYTATDPEGRAITWSLSGDDEGDFTIAGGVLAFAATPDYENPTDANTDNVYMVTVTASDPSGLSDFIDVTVTVLDGDNTLTLSSALPRVCIELTARLTDPNAPVSGVAWQWGRSSDDGTYADIAGAKSASYTPVAGDLGYHLRVTVTYTDRLGVVKDATATTPNKVAVYDPLVARYDANTNGEIEKREVIAAINDYRGGGPNAPSRADVIRLINIYLWHEEYQECKP